MPVPLVAIPIFGRLIIFAAAAAVAVLGTALAVARVKSDEELPSGAPKTPDEDNSLL